MNINYLPMIWKYRRDWFSGGRDVLVDVGLDRILIRPMSYDLYVVGEVFWEQVYAPRLADVTSPAVVLDLGANIGLFSLWAARRWQPGRIIAVEMEADNYRLLEQNIRLNDLTGKVVPVKAAVWDANGRVGIHHHAFNRGMHQVCPDPASGEVPSLTLERLFDQFALDQIDFLKMDIEGAEQRLFTPANEHVFKHCVRHLAAELHPTKGTRVPSVVAYLEHLGFTVRLRQQWLRLTPLLEAVNNRCIK